MKSLASGRLAKPAQQALQSGSLNQLDKNESPSTVTDMLTQQADATSLDATLLVYDRHCSICKDTAAQDACWHESIQRSSVHQMTTHSLPHVTHHLSSCWTLLLVGRLRSSIVASCKLSIPS